MASRFRIPKKRKKKRSSRNAFETYKRKEEERGESLLLFFVFPSQAPRTVATFPQSRTLLAPGLIDKSSAHTFPPSLLLPSPYSSTYTPISFRPSAFLLSLDRSHLPRRRRRRHHRLLSFSHPSLSHFSLSFPPPFRSYIVSTAF